MPSIFDFKNINEIRNKTSTPAFGVDIEDDPEKLTFGKRTFDTQKPQQQVPTKQPKKSVFDFNTIDEVRTLETDEAISFFGDTKTSTPAISFEKVPERGKPFLPEGALEPDEFIGDPNSTRDMIANTLLGLPRATLETLPFTRLLTEDRPKRFEDRADALRNEAFNFVKDIARLVTKVPISAYSLLKDEPIEQQVKNVPLLARSEQGKITPLTGEVETFEKQAYDLLISGVSPIEVGITLGAEAAITAGIIGDFAIGGVRAIKPLVTKRTIRVPLTRQDVIDITRGVDVSKQKVDAFKQAVDQGIRLGRELKKGEVGAIEVRVETPNEIGQILYEPVNKTNFRRFINEIKKRGEEAGVPGGFEAAPGESPISLGMSTKRVMPKGEGDIPKDLQPLAKEARKYDTAEEFVRAIKDVRYKSATSNKLTKKEQALYDLTTFDSKTKEGLAAFNEFAKFYKGEKTTEGTIEALTNFYNQATKKAKQEDISKDLQPLAKEARKYDTAEEFVEKINRIADADIKIKGFKGELQITSVYPRRLIRGIGFTKDRILTEFKDRQFKMEEMIKKHGFDFPRKGDITVKFPTEDMKAFMDTLEQDGFLKKISEGTPTGKNIPTYHITKKLLDYKTKFTKPQLTDIWKKAKQEEGIEPLGEQAEQELALQELTQEQQAEQELALQELTKEQQNEIAEVEANVFTELSLAEAGDRVLKRSLETREVVGVLGKKSTFPDWVPDGLRSRKLFDKVQSHILKNTRPEKGRVKELYDVVQDRIDEQLQDKGFRIGERPVGRTRRIIEVIDKRKPIKGLTKTELQKLGKKEPAPFVRKRETTLLKERLRNQKTGAIAGERGTREKITERLTQANQIIENSNLSVKDKAKFRFTDKQISKIKNPDTFNKKIDTIIERVEELEKKAEKREAIANLRSTVKGTDIKKLRPEFRKEIESLLSDIDVLNTSEKKLTSLQKTRDFLKENPDSIIPDSMLEDLQKLEKKQLRDFTVEDIRKIDVAINHLVKLNKLKNNLIFAGKLRKFQEIKQATIERIETKSIEPPEDPNIISTEDVDKSINKAQQLAGVDSYGVEDIAEIMDRTKKPYGLDDIVDEAITGQLSFRQPISDVMYRNINEGVSEVLRFRHGVDDFLRQGLEDIDFENMPSVKERTQGATGKAWSKAFVTNNKHVDFIEIKISNGRTLKLTKGEKIALYLHSFRAQSRQHLLNGGFSFERSPTKINKLTEKDLDIVRESMTENELRVAEKTHQFFNMKAKNAINEKSVDLNGFEIALEDNYFPIRTNSIDRFRSSLRQKDNLTPDTMMNFYQTTLEGMGIFKETTNATNALILEDSFKAIEKHKMQVSSYVGLANPLRNIKALVYDKDFRIKVTERFGEHYWRALNDFILDTEQTMKKTDNVEKLTQKLINKLDLAILGINPWVMAKQPVSYMLANIEIETKYLNQAKLNREQVEAEMIQHSPQMRDRIEGNVTREVGEVTNIGQVRKTWTSKTPASQHVMDGIRWADMQAVGRVWQAVKAEVADKHPNLSQEDYWKVVSKRHEYVVHRTQPTFLVKDRSKIARSKNIFVRILTKYTTIRNRMYRRIRTQVHRYNMSDRTGADKTRFTKNIFLLTLGSSLLITSIDEARKILIHGKHSTPVEFMLKSLSSTISLAYFAGDMFSSLISKVQRGSFGGFDVSNPVSSFIDNTVDFVAEGIRAIEQSMTDERYKSGKKKGEEKWKTSATRSVEGAIDAGTKLRGIPFKTVKDMLEAGYNIITGNFEDEKTTKGNPLLEGVGNKSNNPLLEGVGGATTNPLLEGL